MRLPLTSRLRRGCLALACGLWITLQTGVTRADTVQVAVAANFVGPMQRIAEAFRERTGHEALLTSGATGRFYAQIRNGAPFDVFLAADEATPARLLKEGHAVQGSGFTYAIGRLVLWSAREGLVDAEAAVLRGDGFRHLAIANPRTAPYGAAALEVMTHLQALDRVRPRFVQGENIAQTYQFVSTGNAELGFVAYSQVVRDGRIGSGSGWLVPEHLHAPIRQDAVLLVRAQDNPAARALLDFLKSEPARAVARAHGYGP